MASTNGIVMPQPGLGLPESVLNPSAKRKRSSVEPDVGNGISESKHTQLATQTSQQQIQDFLEVLKSYDTSPSVLSRHIPARESSTEPDAKRKKSDSNISITSRALSGAYTSLEDVVVDVRTICTAMLDELRLPVEAARTQYSPIPTKTSELASQITIFKKKTEDILRHETARDAKRIATHTSKARDDIKPMLNGMSAAKSITHLTTTPGENKSVLTLYGNAPGAKQLFSSLQEPIKVEGGRSDVTGPLREAGLPNGISTTQIVPIQSTGLVEEKKAVPTMGEIFCAPSSSLPLQPPKPSRYSTKSLKVQWYQPGQSESSRSQGSQTYHGMEITTGQWLDYNASSIVQKRKQRERGMSVGTGRSTTDIGENESLQLEALFKNAYSSFAPSKDDTAAIVSGGQLNRVWWQNFGEKSFDRIVRNNANIRPTDDSDAITSNTSVLDDELAAFEDAVNNWDEKMVDPNLEDVPATPIQDKDVEEILGEISELLETLNSYQRNRFLARKADEAAKPTAAETATYNTLKAQLSLMIAMLPPYAVAKLNSDQLNELWVSTKIPVLVDTFKGVMEEDEEAQRAKVAEMASRSRTAPSPSTHRSSTALYGNQYASTSRPAVPTGSQYYSSQTPIRPPTTSSSRPPATAPAPYAQRPPSGTSYRSQASYAPPTYPHQLPRTTQTPYAGPTPQYYQTPSQSYGAQQNYGSQTAVSARYQAPSTSYVPRQPSANGLDYRYNNGTAARQPSPQKPQTYSPQPASAQPNRSYGTPTPSLSQDRRYYQAPLPNGTSVTPLPQTSQQTAGGLGATGYHTVMTPAEQSTMMERQRAQLAQQQGTQHQARASAQASTMNGSGNVAVNGNDAVTAG